jgi:23S rRNA (cytidine1920-2'-O)/16S rRNA (cytidine1409-2'-O)-methyltransferase
VSPRTRAPFVALPILLRRRFPDLADPSIAITAGHVLVDGAPICNPAARVRADASVRVVAPRPLRGTVKLRGALTAFALDARGAVALDLGAAAGGFTQALLDAGARRVYAVDAGAGQLRGWLRADRRVVVLERTNLGVLGPGVVRDSIDLVTMDLSYLSVADALPQLDHALLAPRAALVALVKPTYELRQGALAAEPTEVRRAVARAAGAMDGHGWAVRGHVGSPIKGSRGAVEVFVYARLRGRRNGRATGGW